MKTEPRICLSAKIASATGPAVSGVAIALCFALSACGSSAMPVVSNARATEPSAAAASAADNNQLALRRAERAELRLANTAYHGNRIITPSDDNAVMHALRAREINPDSAGAAELLIDCMPLATAQVQGMIAAGKADEAKRALALLRQVNPDSFATLSLHRRLSSAAKAGSSSSGNDSMP